MLPLVVTLAVLAGAVFLFVTEKLAVDVVALLVGTYTNLLVGSLARQPATVASPSWNSRLWASGSSVPAWST